MSLNHDAQLALACLDYTRLQEDDSGMDITAFVAALDNEQAPPAALCVYPQWLALTRSELDKLGFEQVPLATVTNFPSGEDSLGDVLEQTHEAIAAGAKEVDLVLPYQAMIAGDRELALDYVKQSKAVCEGRAKLKVIIESGELDEKHIRIATQIAIDGGADFVKTSTGKVPENATLEAVQTIFEVINSNPRNVGVKVSGGVRDVEQAKEYLDLAVKMKGSEWVTPFNFRFGASSLLADLYRHLS